MWNSASGTVEVAPNERKHPLCGVRLRACNMRGAGNPGLRTGMKLLNGIRDGHLKALATLQRLEAIYGPIERAKLAAGTRRPWFRVHRGSGR